MVKLFQSNDLQHLTFKIANTDDFLIIFMSDKINYHLSFNLKKKSLVKSDSLMYNSKSILLEKRNYSVKLYHQLH